MEEGKNAANRELFSGLGRPNLILKTPRIKNGRAVIFELKTARQFQDMQSGCQEALEQIRQKKYQEGLRQEGLYGKTHECE